MKTYYIDIMEAALKAYSEEKIREWFDVVKKTGLTEHGFPRLTANLGILIAHGKSRKLMPLFVEMMDFCCKDFPDSKTRNKYVGNDFSVKEIIFALLELERAKVFPDELTQSWRSELSKIDPYREYTCIAPDKNTRVGNLAAYNFASEFMREYIGLCNSDEFVDVQIASQILSFDENGMYRDPNEPMLYDFATRSQFAVLLHFGYDGEYRDLIDENLKKAALLSLKMQSVTGEIPFGGRSNQFLFNEAYLAAVFEFEATRYLREGNAYLAGQFKRGARLAADSITEWLHPGRETHVKNRYPRYSKLGCEGYAYFDKYMISLASFIYIAYLFADDAVTEVQCPAEIGGFTAVTSEHFHKLFMNCGGYSLEYELCADQHYDACGLGRIHKIGAPSALCLSVPFAKNPNYHIEWDENPSGLSLSGTAYKDDKWHLGAMADAYRLIDRHESVDKLEASLEYSAGVITLTENVTVTANGV